MPTTPIVRNYSFDPADFAVPLLDEVAAIVSLRTAAIETYAPINAQELFAVEQIALAELSMLRLARLEAGLVHHCLATGSVEPSGPFLVPKRDAGTVNIFLRYKAQTHRLFRMAIEDFERLKATRPFFPNEPIEWPTTIN
jgi:hypothetical protein